VHDFHLEVLLGRSDFAPGRLIRHAHQFGRLIDGSCFDDLLKKHHPTLGHYDSIVLINDTLAGL
jgi:hypothetical protein